MSSRPGQPESASHDSPPKPADHDPLTERTGRVLAMIWFGGSNATVRMVIIVSALPVVFLGAAQGIATRDRGLDRMAQAFGAGPLGRFLAVGLRQTTTKLFPKLAPCRTALAGQAMSVLSLMCVEHAYLGRSVLKAINLSVAAQEIVALVGPSGCGKSTLAHVAAGLLEPRGGALSRVYQRAALALACA